ncbi:Mg++ transport, ATPase protein [Leifsonia xyli subsp. cynodontis DSM 46306]|jgi:putative Mg2+ transporter-C (MgtC) family protein|uniref:MgtC/SapB family protein n=1 Tax=Leifsonia xyli subsp. cynodontis DSM 46306 TaxID=1389489 RepID=U3P6J2_LEIXC|nr:MgtC/SapB family protein [Leifsonia xyli]AGW40537.1 Mg++ transport, ATPase protein [Leifsonia xyli subsp. cynodontis DSM 46306]
MTLTVDIALRVLLAVGCGALIGLERQWRARTAGVRTNALVSLGAALFVVMGAYSFHGPDADPTRVAAQIVSGIGFLGAGVIMKQGASVSGLNTAATLWASAAVGALAGGGLLAVAAGGTLIVMLANTLLRPLGRLLDRRAGSSGKETLETDYVFEVRCRVEAEVEVRALVFEAVHRPGFVVRSITAADEPDGAVLITAAVHSDERDDHKIEEALAAVVVSEAVTAVRWSASETAMAD